MDFETSGSTPGRFVPIEVGVAVGSMSTSQRIGGWDWDRWEWQPEAEAVHDIPQDTLDGEPPVGLVDGALALWLWQRTRDVSDRMLRVSVGWDVAGFDLAIVRRWMPLLSSLLGYRTIDLGALCLALDGVPHPSGQGRWSYGRAKSEAKTAAEAAEPDTAWHTAGYDARAALVSLGEIRQWLGAEGASGE